MRKFRFTAFAFAYVLGFLAVFAARRWDTEVFLAVNGLVGRFAWLDAAGIFAAKGLIFLLIAAVAVLSASEVRRHRSLLAAGLFAAAAVSASLAWIGNQAFGRLVLYRNRPFVSLEGVESLIGAPLTDKSFPSDHSTVAFALAFTVALSRPRWAVFFVAAAVLVAVGRVFVGVHYLSDILAGMAVGGLWALIVRIGWKRIDRYEHGK